MTGADAVRRDTPEALLMWLAPAGPPLALPEPGEIQADWAGASRHGGRTVHGPAGAGGASGRARRTADAWGDRPGCLTRYGKDDVGAAGVRRRRRRTGGGRRAAAG